MAFLTDTGASHLISKLSDSKNIKINNKYGNRVYNVVNKLVEKADKITKAINQDVTNTSHSFKVGVGDVDVSSDVEDGFTPLSIKGTTYQNIFRDFASNNSSVINITEDRIKWTKTEVADKPSNIRYHNALTELSKVYTLIFFIYKNTMTRSNMTIENYPIAKFNITSYNVGVHFIRKRDIGLVKVALQQPATVGKDGVKPYLEVYDGSVGELEISHPILLEGDYTNDPNIPLSFKGIAGVGEASRNLFDRSNPNNILNGYGNNTGVITVDNTGKYKSIVCKVEGGKTYTITKKLSSRLAIECTSAYPANGVASVRIFNENYGTKATVTVPEGYNYLLCYVYNQNFDLGIDINKLDIQIEEGTINTDYQPYGSYKIDILSQGKNLYNIHNDLSLTYGVSKIEDGVITTKELSSYETFGLVNDNNNVDVRIFNRPTKIIKGKTYSISCKVRRVSGAGNLNYFSIFGFKKDYNKFSYTGISYERLYGMNLSEDWLELKYSGTAEDNFDTVSPAFQVPISANGLILQIKDIQIEYDEPTDFESYREDKMQILLDEPLMKLPNGICDEITKDGKLIRRVGKIVLDGSFNAYPTRTSDENKNRWVVWVDKSVKNISSESPLTLMCDRYNCIPSSASWNGSDDGISQNVSENRLHLFIDKYSASTTENELAINKELRNNPATVYYELQTPIVTDIIDPTIRVFKNGFIRFNNLIAPNSTHQVQLNKPAQIENTINETDILNSRIEDIEAVYDDLLLKTSSGIDLLRLDFNLGKEDK